MKVLFIVSVLCSIAMGVVVAQEPPETLGLYTFESPSSGIQFQFPNTWIADVQSNGTINLVSDPFIWERSRVGFDHLFGDDVALSMEFVPTDYATAYGVEGETTQERLELLAARISEDVEVGDVEILDNGIYRVSVRQDGVFDGWFAVWDITEDLTGIATLQTAPDNLDVVDAIGIDILLSVQFNTSVEALLAQQSGGAQ